MFSHSYILFYYCENLPHNILNQIFSYAKEHGLAVYGAGEYDKRYSEITVNLMPFEWVEMFRNAEFVFKADGSKTVKVKTNGQGEAKIEGQLVAGKTYVVSETKAPDGLMVMLVCGMAKPCLVL
jgi:hypothetical protein